MNQPLLALPHRDRLELIAHRGFSAIAPENTLTAFTEAIAAGADSIECDVQLSADGVPVIFHNPTLEKNAGVAEKVTEKTLAELKTLDVGSWFDDRFCGLTIPTLAETLDAISKLPKYLYLDVKPHCYWSAQAIDQLITMLHRQGWTQRCIVSSFNYDFIRQIRQRSPQITLGFIVASATDYQQQLDSADKDGNAIMIGASDIIFNHPDFIATSRDRGIDTVAWTIDRLETIQQLFDLGITRIVTNRCIVPKS
jgi:glycerophosphoryl diester phosphodiesterase